MRWFRPRRHRELVDRLDLPRPFNLTLLCRSVGEQRGRPIVLVPLGLSALGPCGLWLATDTVDYICYEQDTSVPHQEHIVLHELGHILCGHGGSETLGTSLGGMFPDLGGEALRIMLARGQHGYADQQEAEAESFAYALLDRVHDRRDDREPDGLPSRLGKVLEA